MTYNGKYSCLILDADIYYKLVQFEDINAFIKIIDNITDKAYIHEYVYKEEILTKREQLEQLIAMKKLEILYPKNILDKIGYSVYKDSFKILCEEYIGLENLCKRHGHLGEVYSLAIAKALSITIFMSDEGGLKPIIKRLLNTGINDINMFRLKNIIHWIRHNPECNITRREAKKIFCYTCSKGNIKNRKRCFDDIWKI
ncbi:hypothetical protein [Clostridium kluyveri]|uniref:PIN domain-containing protein n=1 Tax=Clostridium kluyveri TaxID=1534 RepID=A0A1L5F8N0_CLOKL|nr:hypothetical protein [Clostridium kluyveri]APM39170.1 hypothetical protein BS101_10645 [Clostridium kluyveri]UZQ51498.1 hypothetical protein OP486_04780 [Clostridium kluyveri]